jgi:hypothetical protein
MSDRRTAGVLLIAYLALDVVLLMLSVSAPRNGSVITRGSLLWYLLDVILVCRIWRGGKISWFILAVLSVFSLCVVALSQWPWNWSAAFTILTLLIQAGILVLPVVRRLARGSTAVPQQ